MRGVRQVTEVVSMSRQVQHEDPIRAGGYELMTAFT